MRRLVNWQRLWTATDFIVGAFPHLARMCLAGLSATESFSALRQFPRRSLGKPNVCCIWRIGPDLNWAWRFTRQLARIAMIDIAVMCFIRPQHQHHIPQGGAVRQLPGMGGDGRCQHIRNSTGIETKDNE